ncbi:MAG: histidine kinase N-terminal 7TM domain-containing protein [Dehalococcoidales bacterium]|nr:histidine kinase N-terminal 7TM domain-containing protein [Dehalococcoidales bacterium]
MLHFLAEAFSPPQPAFIFTGYSLGYSVSSAICFFVAFIAWSKRSTDGGNLLLIMIISAAFWSLFGIFEVSATAQETKILFSKLEYLAGAPVPALLLLFSANHVGLKKYIRPGKLIFLFVIPAVTLIMALTNQYHGLVWSSFSPGPTGSNLIVYGHGFWYWFGVIGYSGLCVLVSILLLIRFSITTHRKFRCRSMLIAVGALIPLIAVLVYSSDFNPFPGYDLGRVAFSVSGLLFLLAITRGKLMNLVPVERNLVFESIRDGILVVDNQDTIIDANPAAAALLKTESSILIGHTVAEIAGSNPWISAFSCASPDATHLCIVTDSGHHLEAGINTTRLNNRHVVKIITFLDVTEKALLEEKRQELRNQIEVSSRLVTIGEMAAGIAHEINNPLTTIIGFSDLLLKEPLPDEAHIYAKHIYSESNRVKDIIRRMLTFARQEKPCTNRMDIHAVLESTLEIRQFLLANQDIELIRDYDFAIPWVYVDSAQMQQVFLNLIINAEQALQNTKGQGRLTISTSSSDNRVYIAFRDNGPGIPPDIIDRVFNPFFTTKEPGEGTGLGLSLSHSIVAVHNGEILVESEIGAGSCFTIVLPADNQI